MAILSGWDTYYGIPFFDKIFAEASDRHFEEYYEGLVENLDLREKETLELGGGTGLISRRIYNLYGTKPTLVDITKKAYKRFRQMNGVGRYIIGSAFDIDLKKEFDFVFSDGLIEHFPYQKQKQLIESHKRHCKKEGHILIAAPKDGLGSRLFSAIVTYEKGYEDGELRKLVGECGLEVLEEIDRKRYVAVLAKKK